MLTILTVIFDIFLFMVFLGGLASVFLLFLFCFGVCFVSFLFFIVRLRVFWFCSVFVFKSGSCYEIQAGLEHTILLP